MATWQRHVGVDARATVNPHSMFAPRARRRARTCLKGCAGRTYVVDEDDPQPGCICAARKSPAHVRLPFGPGHSHLRSRCALPNQHIFDHGQR